MKRNTAPNQLCDEPVPVAKGLSSGQFLRKLVDSSVMPLEQVQALRARLTDAQRVDSRRLADDLVEQCTLTRYQADLILRGNVPLSLGNYDIIDRIGRGGMGVVFKARHRRMQRVVALKLLHPTLAKRSPDAIRRFEQEVRTAALVQHPNIVTAFDADETRGVPFLVMEYVDGTDLGRLVLGRGPLQVAAAVEYVVQAARGLEHAHASGIIHRDVKPSNLLLDRRGVVRVLDLGLSRLLGNEPQVSDAGKVVGSCDYLAPEQALDAGSVDVRADVYGLGATLFFLLTRRPLFSRGTPFEKIRAHREGRVPSLQELRPDVPPTLEVVFRKMVAKDPEDRYPTMAHAREALQEVGEADSRGPGLPAGHIQVLAAELVWGQRDSTAGSEVNRPATTVASHVSLRAQVWVLAALLAASFGLLAWTIWRAHTS